MDHGKVNALDLEFLRHLTTTFASLRDARAVVLTGATRAFSAGVDLNRLLDERPGHTEEFLEALSDAFIAVFDHPRPVIAAINGHAIAGGCVLAAACDVRLMSAGSIGLSELKVGVPFPITAVEIIRHATGTAADSLIVEASLLDPEQARSVGLVHHVVEPEGLLEESLRRAEAMAAIPDASFELSKQQLRRAARERIDRYRDADDKATAGLWKSDEVRESIGSFLASLRR